MLEIIGKNEFYQDLLMLQFDVENFNLKCGKSLKFWYFSVKYFYKFLVNRLIK